MSITAIRTVPTVTDLVGRLAIVPGLVRPGISSWDMTTRLPLHPLAVESAYGDPGLLHDMGVSGAGFADRLEVEVIVGAETGGIPLAAAVSLAGGLPFAFARKPGYVGHEEHEPRAFSVDNVLREAFEALADVSMHPAVEIPRVEALHERHQTTPRENALS